MTLPELLIILAEYREPGIKMEAQPYTLTPYEECLAKKNRMALGAEGWHIDVATLDEQHIETIFVTCNHPRSRVKFLITMALIQIREKRQRFSVAPYLEPKMVM